MLANTIADTLQKKIAELGLPLAVDLWNEKKVIGKSPPRATLKFSSPSTLMLLANPSLGKFAESYVEGRVDFSGRIRDVIDLLLPLIGLPESVRAQGCPRRLVERIFKLHAVGPAGKCAPCQCYLTVGA